MATLVILAPVALSDWLGLGLSRLPGVVGAVLALATIATTSMIYAQLKTVPRWNHWTTPAQFFAFALAGGAMLAGQGEGDPDRHTRLLLGLAQTVSRPDGFAEVLGRPVRVVGVPGDREVDLKRAEVAFAPAAVEAATDDDFAAAKGLVKGYIGPWSAKGPVLGEESSTGIRYLLDPRVGDGTSWITGANEPEKHVYHLVAGRDFVGDGRADIAEVRAGDPAPPDPGHRRPRTSN